jgi:hypothetical protein
VPLVLEEQESALVTSNVPSRRSTTAPLREARQLHATSHTKADKHNPHDKHEMERLRLVN